MALWKAMEDNQTKTAPIQRQARKAKEETKTTYKEKAKAKEDYQAQKTKTKAKTKASPPMCYANKMASTLEISVSARQVLEVPI